MKIKHFLQLIRYKNLLMLVFMMILFKSSIYPNTDIFYLEITKNNFYLLVFSVLLITAAGNIINDIFDIEIDKINKPNKIIIEKYISKKKSLILYNVLNILGLFLGICLSIKTNKVACSLIFIFTSLSLFFYSKSLKRIALLGNVFISVFISLSIYLVYLFSESYDVIRNYFVFHLFLVYMFFAFILNFIREIVKDIEDIDGDYSQNMKTLPILIGRKRTQNVVFTLTIIPFVLSTFFAFVYFKNQYLMTLYILFLIILPLGYFMYKILDIKSKKEFHKLSTLLKIIMFLGVCSILLIKL